MTLTFPTVVADLKEGLRAAVRASPRSSAIESTAFSEMRSVGQCKAVREKRLHNDNNSRVIFCFLQNRKTQEKLQVIGKKNYHSGHFSSSVEEALSLLSWQATVGGQTLS